jgi:Spy/CpxP family protein refolding chaperone
MNPLVVIIILGLGISLTAFAEKAVPAPETANSSLSAAPEKAGKHHKKTLDEVGDELELNEKQKFKIKSLFKEKKKELKALKEALKEEGASTPVKADKEQVTKPSKKKK